jgi:hypothetical protein
MTSLQPARVPEPVVRRRQVVESVEVLVQQLAVRPVPSPHVVPRQVDPVRQRLTALEQENDALRAAVEQLGGA